MNRKIGYRQRTAHYCSPPNKIPHLFDACTANYYCKYDYYVPSALFPHHIISQKCASLRRIYGKINKITFCCCTKFSLCLYMCIPSYFTTCKCFCPFKLQIRTSNEILGLFLAITIKYPGAPKPALASSIGVRCASTSCHSARINSFYE